MKKIIGLGTTAFLVASSFFPDSLIFIMGIVAVCLFIAVLSIKHRLKLSAYQKETFPLIMDKIFFEFLSVAPLVISLFLFIQADYRWAFVVIGIILILIQFLKVVYYIYAKNNACEKE